MNLSSDPLCVVAAPKQPLANRLDVRRYAGLLVHLTPPFAGSSATALRGWLFVGEPFPMAGHDTLQIYANDYAFSFDLSLIPREAPAAPEYAPSWIWLPVRGPECDLAIAYQGPGAGNPTGGGFVAYGCSDYLGPSPRMLKPSSRELISTQQAIVSGASYTAEFWHLGPCDVVVESDDALAVFDVQVQYLSRFNVDPSLGVLGTYRNMWRGRAGGNAIDTAGVPSVVATTTGAVACPTLATTAVKPAAGAGTIHRVVSMNWRTPNTFAASAPVLFRGTTSGLDIWMNQGVGATPFDQYAGNPVWLTEGISVVNNSSVTINAAVVYETWPNASSLADASLSTRVDAMGLTQIVVTNNARSTVTVNIDVSPAWY